MPPHEWFDLPSDPASSSTGDLRKEGGILWGSGKEVLLHMWPTVVQIAEAIREQGESAVARDGARERLTIVIDSAACAIDYTRPDIVSVAGRAFRGRIFIVRHRANPFGDARPAVIRAGQPPDRYHH